MEDDVPEPLSESGKAVIKQSIQLMLEKLAKYEDILDDKIAGWASMILDPRFKMRWITRHLSNSKSTVILTRLRDLYERSYPHPAHSARGNDTGDVPPEPDRSLPSYNTLLDLSSDDEADTVDEISDYLAQPTAPQTLDEGQILAWWMVSKERWPRLFNMAMDLLSIPAMSSENERSFSQAKLVITSQRHSLHHTTVQQLTYLKAWNVAGDFPEVWDGTDGSGGQEGAVLAPA